MALTRLRIIYPEHQPFIGIHDHLESIKAKGKSYGEVSAYQKLCIQIAMDEIKAAMNDNELRHKLLAQYGTDVVLIMDLLNRPDAGAGPKSATSRPRVSVQAEAPRAVQPPLEPAIVAQEVEPSAKALPVKEEHRPSVSVDAGVILDPAEVTETRKSGRQSWSHLKGLAGPGKGVE